MTAPSVWRSSSGSSRISFISSMRSAQTRPARRCWPPQVVIRVTNVRWKNVRSANILLSFYLFDLINEERQDLASKPSHYTGRQMSGEKISHHPFNIVPARRCWEPQVVFVWTNVRWVNILLPSLSYYLSYLIDGESPYQTSQVLVVLFLSGGQMSGSKVSFNSLLL